MKKKNYIAHKVEMALANFITFHSHCNIPSQWHIEPYWKTRIHVKTQPNKNQKKGSKHYVHKKWMKKMIYFLYSCQKYK